MGDFKGTFCEECQSLGFHKYDEVRSRELGKLEFAVPLIIRLLNLVSLILAYSLFGLCMVWEFPSRVKQAGEKYYRKIMENNLNHLRR